MNNKITVRRWLRVVWHTRPRHSLGLVTIHGRPYCSRCGTDLAR